MPASNKIQSGYIEAQDGVQFAIDAGTAAAPGLVFDDSAATGLYSPGTGQIAWSTSGKQTALRILADGKVGIDCSPTVALEVNGTIKASAIDAPIEGTLDDWIVHAGDTNTKIGFPGNDQFEIHAGGGPKVHVNSSGYVGIGTSTMSNSERLAVQLGNDEMFELRSAAQELFQVWKEGSTEECRLNVKHGGATKIHIRGNGTSYFDGGRFGVGTNAPSFFTEIDASGVLGDVLKIKGSSTGQMVNIQNTGGSSIPSIVRFANHAGNAFWDVTYDNSNNNFTLDYLDSVKLTIKSTGIDVTGTITLDTVAGTNTNADLKVLFQTAAGTIDGGSGLTYNPANDVLTVNGADISANTFRGSGGEARLSNDNHSSTDYVKVTDKIELFDGGTAILTTSSTGMTVKGNSNLSAISITSGLESPYDEAGTGETIFVYDTRNDADGGAWRKKCRHTSWYNEGSGTYRGTRKEFPAVAVIVLGQVRTTIYDADDPSMPLWMQFRSSSSGYMLGCNDDRSSCVTALNGVLYIGAKNVYGGFHIIDFINDTAKRVRGAETSNGTNGWWPSGIAGRNGTNDSGGVWHESDAGGRGYDNTALGTLKTDDVWSVAVKALRGAPIDPITNLPIPTIAVGVDGGISIIKPEWHLGLNRSNTESYQHNDVSGHIVDINSNNSGYTLGRSVEWTDNDDLIFVMGDGNGDFDYIHTMDGDIKWDNTITVDTKTSNNNHHVRSMWRGNKSASAIYSNLLSRGSDWSTTWNTHQHKVNQVTAKKGYEFAARTRNGLNHIYENPEGSNSMIAYTTKSYTTGWMVGKEKCCIMASTDTTNITANRLEPNNSCTAGPGRTEANTTTGWTNGGFGTFESSNTRAYHGSYSLHLTADSNGDNCSASFTTVVGKYYTVSAKLWVTHDSFTIKLGTSIGDGNQYFESNPIGTSASWQHFTGTFQATATTAYFNITESSTSQDSDGFIDDVVFTEGVPDHTSTHGFSGSGGGSNFNRGAHIYGTITKSAVATGAELVGYSGWTSNNFLYMPCHPDLNYGADDFSVYWWMNPNDSQSGTMIWSIDNRNSLANNSAASYIRVYFNGDDMRFDLSTAGYAYQSFQKGLQSHIQNRNSWMLCHIIRRGETMEMWANGRREYVKNLDAGMKGNAIMDEKSELRIGQDSNTGSADNNIQMALFRSSRSAPNKHQIEKMYKDELALFQENAKCTLVGTTNDHIEAMAYDKRSDILYVGAKGGRADFSGLVRINNNTTEVTRGMSASNDLVVEY